MGSSKFRNFPFYNEHEYLLEDLNLRVIRRQFCPDDAEGVVITFEISDQSNSQQRQLSLSFLGRTDLSPVWFSEEIGIVDGADHGYVDNDAGFFVGKDKLNPWYVIFGASQPFQKSRVDQGLFGPMRTAGNGVSGELTYENIILEPGETVEMHFFIAGSYQSEEQARSTFEMLYNEHNKLFEQKKERYEELLDQTQVTLPDKQLENVFNWVKFHNDWLVREVPEIGRGLGAGHPEYPWWFGCDNSYALLGLLPVGQLQLVHDTLELIHNVSEMENGNGRIIHEVTTNGAVSNKGNTQETPHFIKCVWDSFLWTGDITFLESMYPAVKKGISWLLEEMDTDGDLLPEGYGIIEIEGLNVELIDSAVYTYEALRVSALMAELFKEHDLADQYRKWASELEDKINRDLWLEKEGLYADAMATTGEVLERMDLYIERARKSGAESAAVEQERMKKEMEQVDADQERPWLFKNWVINTPMEVGLAPKEKAIRALDRMTTDEFTGPWGTYLSGMYRTQMMTISTGVQAVAECKYDRMDEALRYVRLIASTFNKRVPGSISEMSPDGGCFVQAWTNYGITWPLMTYMFGIQPKAYWREITLRPRLPQEWDNASVKHVTIGAGDGFNELELTLSRSDQEDVYYFSLKKNGWTVCLDLDNAIGATVLVDGIKVKNESKQDGVFEIKITDASHHEIRVKR